MITYDIPSVCLGVSLTIVTYLICNLIRMIFVDWIESKIKEIATPAPNYFIPYPFYDKDSKKLKGGKQNG